MHYIEMVQVKPSPEYYTPIMSIIAQKRILDISYLARTSEQTSLTQTLKQTWRLSVTGGVEKPRWIIIGLQNDKNGSQEKNPEIFDNMDLTNAYVTLNSERFPMRNLNFNFATNNYMKLYDMYALVISI